MGLKEEKGLRDEMGLREANGLREEEGLSEEKGLGEEAGATSTGGLQWIERRPGVPYFLCADGAAWTPVGHNDAVDWPELAGLYRRRDVPSVRRHLKWLKAHGVTCLRLMLEYAQGRHRYLEKPAGRFVPNMVRFWDDLFELCEEVGLYLLLTPFDTFFTWRAWEHHPYNRRNGGPCAGRGQLTTCPATRRAIKARLEFATRRWGASPALFAWDLWNELHPAHGGNDPGTCEPFITDLSDFLRSLELRLHGRAHLQTVSIFGLSLPGSRGPFRPAFRHPGLDFASPHLYDKSTIDDPRDTVSPAVATGRLMRTAIEEAEDLRPVFDSEHGPIHAFLDRHRKLPEPFDDEYFRHIQWAHLASGGAGGGMRWPNRHPHVLTPGMRQAQLALSRFLPCIEWSSFLRRNLNAEAQATEGFHVFACGDAHQAIAWLLRANDLGPDGMMCRDSALRRPLVTIPGLAAGRYRVMQFDTRLGKVVEQFRQDHDGGNLPIACGEVGGDGAIAVVHEAASSVK